MHISLDSALGQQRRLNQVGESITQIAPDPAAAYSLRSLTGSDPKVVRVRRESDNHEQDFTASEVSSGALVDFVNTQVTAPLDIQALTATGRDGDFLIAKAAYSLRSLGTRQATVAATGDTVARANGKYVCQVRRDSDDALKSFTADEVIDGTLLSFVNENINIYTSDYSAGVDGWIGVGGDRDGNIDGIGGRDDNLRFTSTSSNIGGNSYLRRNNFLELGSKYKVTFDFYIPSSNNRLDGIASVEFGGQTIDLSSLTALDQWVSASATSTTATTATNIIIRWEDSSESGDATGDVAYIRNVSITSVVSSGFVKTWYDQSVTTQAGDTATGNHATQATAAKQPKIVSAGALLNELDFDGTDDTLAIDFGADLSQASSLFIVHQSDTSTDTANEFFDSAASASPRTLLDQSGSDYRMLSGSTSVGTGVAITTDKSLIFALYNGSSSLFAKNGTTTSALNAGTTDIKQNSTIGSSNTRFYDGSMQEFIIYNSDQTDNRTAIEANIGEHYSISGIPAFDNSVNGFVETWYDQSGNGNNATQATAGSQPKIVNAGSYLGLVKTDGVDDFFNLTTTINFNSSHGVFAVYADATGNRYDLIGNTTSSNGIGYAFAGSTTMTFGMINSGSQERFAFGTGTRANQNLISLLWQPDSASAIYSLNGSGNSQDFTLSRFTGDNAIPITVIGKDNDAVGQLDLKEIIIYATDQTSNRTTIEANMAAAHGITLS